MELLLNDPEVRFASVHALSPVIHSEFPELTRDQTQKITVR